jgi:uncharacterized protein YqkB
MSTRSWPPENKQRKKAVSNLWCDGSLTELQETAERQCCGITGSGLSAIWTMDKEKQGGVEVEEEAAPILQRQLHVAYFH